MPKHLILTIALAVTAAAQVRPLHTRDLTRLSQVQVGEHLKKSDIIFVPVGAVETNGIQPSGRDYVWPLAYAMAMAEETGGLYMPGLVWSFPGTTAVASATINNNPHEGTQFLAMELVEGETLEKKLKGGALPVEDALRLALQIAEALEAAHEKGVVHRDLKPANVMLTRDGRAKVLDFGLAKAFSGVAGEASPAHSPALSLAMTQAGLVLGTAGYMSPEQASGQATDQRADLWAFGVVLYEMLAGKRAFEGEDVSDTLAAVLTREPDFAALPATTPASIVSLLRHCLERDPKRRLHDIGDGRMALDASATPASAVTRGVSTPAPSRPGRARAAWRCRRGRRRSPW